MKALPFALFTMLLVVGCGKQGGEFTTQPRSGGSLVEARRGFKTKPVQRAAGKDPVEQPPASLFNVVQYDSPVGKLAAYLSIVPKDVKKRPAIIWITGGDCNSIGDVWSRMPVNNDQSASAYRSAGIIMMFPSLRGGNENPGVREGYFGEVDDILAAADFLAKQDGVDPQRIYLGGHSTGGTLVLLTAACTDRFRAVFSFGPVEDVAGYPPQFQPFDTNNPKELELRAPIRWLQSIRCPVYVFEGTGGNISSLNALSRASRNSLIHFYPVQGRDHFTILYPLNRLIAAKVLEDNGTTTNIAFKEEELSKMK